MPVENRERGRSCQGKVGKRNSPCDLQPRRVRLRKQVDPQSGLM